MVFASDISKFELQQTEAHLGFDNIGCRLPKCYYLITLEVMMACKTRVVSSPAGSNGRRASIVLVLYVQAVPIDNANLACTMHRP